jgi:hypothetical protein
MNSLMTSSLNTCHDTMPRDLIQLFQRFVSLRLFLINHRLWLDANTCRLKLTDLDVFDLPIVSMNTSHVVPDSGICIHWFRRRGQTTIFMGKGQSSDCLPVCKTKNFCPSVFRFWRGNVNNTHKGVVGVFTRISERGPRSKFKERNDQCPLSLVLT